MSAMQSIFGNSTMSVQSTAATPGNLPANAPASTMQAPSHTTAPNGVIPANSNPESAAASSAVSFADLWKTDNTRESSQGQPLFNVSQEKLLETARLQDFKPVVTQEQMAAITAGGEGAVHALVDMMNSVAQVNYAKSVHATTQLIDGALTKSDFAKTKDLPTALRDLSVNNNLRDANPVFSSPEFAPLMETATKQFQVKYPNATAGELQSLATRYLDSMIQAANQPKQVEQARKQKSTQQDWSKFLE